MMSSSRDSATTVTKKGTVKQVNYDVKTDTTSVVEKASDSVVGVVVYQNTTNNIAKYKEFNNRLKQEIEKPFTKIKFDPLPSEYAEEKLIVIIKFEYSMIGDAKSKSISFNNTGIGYLECGKNNSALISIGALLAIPFVLLYCITIYPIKCIITAN